VKAADYERVRENATRMLKMYCSHIKLLNTDSEPGELSDKFPAKHFCFWFLY